MPPAKLVTRRRWVYVLTLQEDGTSSHFIERHTPPQAPNARRGNWRREFPSVQGRESEAALSAQHWARQNVLEDHTLRRYTSLSVKPFGLSPRVSGMRDLLCDGIGHLPEPATLVVLTPIVHTTTSPLQSEPSSSAALDLAAAGGCRALGDHCLPCSLGV